MRRMAHHRVWQPFHLIAAFRLFNTHAFLGMWFPPNFAMTMGMLYRHPITSDQCLVSRNSRVMSSISKEPLKDDALDSIRYIRLTHHPSPLSPSTPPHLHPVNHQNLQHQTISTLKPHHHNPSTLPSRASHHTEQEQVQGEWPLALSLDSQRLEPSSSPL